MFLILSASVLTGLGEKLGEFVEHSSEGLYLMFSRSSRVAGPSSRHAERVLDVFHHLGCGVLSAKAAAQGGVTRLCDRFRLLCGGSVGVVYQYDQICRRGESERVRDGAGPRCKRPFPTFEKRILFHTYRYPNGTAMFNVRGRGRSICGGSRLSYLVNGAIVAHGFGSFTKRGCRMGVRAIAPSTKRRRICHIVVRRFYHVYRLCCGDANSAGGSTNLELVHRVGLLVGTYSIPRLVRNCFNGTCPGGAIFVRGLVQGVPYGITMNYASVTTFRLCRGLVQRQFPREPMFIIGNSITFGGQRSVISRFSSAVGNVLMYARRDLDDSMGVPSYGSIVLRSLR